MTNVVALIGSIEHGQLKGSLSQSDRAALTMGRRLSMIGYLAKTLTHDHSALAYARAADAVNVAFLKDPSLLEFDILLLGLGALQHCGEWYAGWWAEQRRAALVFDALVVESQSDCLRVVRDLGRGNRETLRVSLPAVLVISNAAHADYVSQYRRWRSQAGGSELPSPNVQSVDPLALHSTAWETARPRTKAAKKLPMANLRERLVDIFSMETPTANGANDDARNTDPSECAQQIIRYLLHHQLIDPSWVVDSTATIKEHESEKRQPTPAQLTPIGSCAIAADFDSPSHWRGPQPVGRTLKGMSRRPRAWAGRTSAATPALPNKLLRRPRVAGTERPNQLRGPFPITPLSAP